MTTRKQMALGLSFFVISGHVEGWRLTAEPHDRERLKYYRDIAKKAEASGLHFMFLGDSLDGAARIGRGWTPSIDPQILASALAAETQHLGFIPSASSIYQDPFTLARSLASLDHLSDGRAGWNVLTSFYATTARQNYTTGRSFAYEDRYAISSDFMQTVLALWDAWEDGAVVNDRASGHYVDAARIHPIGHEGPYFKVSGALNVSRSPQEVPVIFVPVSSADGQDFAARYGEVIFNNQSNFEDMHAFRASLRDRAQARGRDPDALKVTPGVIVIVKNTREEARAEYERNLAHIDPEAAQAKLQMLLGYEARPAPGLPASDWPALPAEASARARDIRDRALARSLTFLDAAYEASASRDFRLLVGTAADVADGLEDWFAREAVDGFVLGPVTAPDGMDDITERLMPELQRRGLARRLPATPATLRQALGLGRYRPAPTAA